MTKPKNKCRAQFNAYAKATGNSFISIYSLSTCIPILELRQCRCKRKSRSVIPWTQTHNLVTRKADSRVNEQTALPRHFEVYTTILCFSVVYSVIANANTIETIYFFHCKGTKPRKNLIWIIVLPSPGFGLHWRWLRLRKIPYRTSFPEKIC